MDQVRTLAAPLLLALPLPAQGATAGQGRAAFLDQEQVEELGRLQGDSVEPGASKSWRSRPLRPRKGCRSRRRWLSWSIARPVPVLAPVRPALRALQAPLIAQLHLLCLVGKTPADRLAWDSLLVGSPFNWP